MTTTQENKIRLKKGEIIYYLLVFFSIFLFFFIVHPLYVFDSDDWGNMVLRRSLLPVISYFNPSKVLPEFLYSFVSLFGAKIIYPITGDYIKSLGLIYSFVYSLFIIFNVICIEYFIKYVSFNNSENKENKAHIIHAISSIILLAFFYLGKDGRYLLHEVNVTCIFHYSIPALLNISVVLLLITLEKRNRQLLCFDEPYKNVILSISLYLCIFSNLFFSSILLSYIVSLLTINFFFQLKSQHVINIKKIITLYLRQNYQYMVVIFMWIISAYFESKGGRAKIGLNNSVSLESIWNSVSFFFKVTLHSIAFRKLTFLALGLIILANIRVVFLYISKRFSFADRKFLSIQLVCFWMTLFIVTYQIMLTIKTGIGYQSRSSLILSWSIWILLEIAISYLYIASLLPKFNIILPFIIINIFLNIFFFNSGGGGSLKKLVLHRNLCHIW